MRFRRRVDDPTARLWRELEGWFREEDGSEHAGPDVGFPNLRPEELERGWEFLAARADSLDPTKTVWDEQESRAVSVVTAIENGAIAAVARYSSPLFPLRNVRCANTRLPWLGVWLFPEELAFYWWVSDSEWNKDTVAGLAELLGDLMNLLPRSHPTNEWDADDDFWPPIERYLNAYCLSRA
jgi:hypothetical protein